MAFCEKCGNRLSDGAEFCAHCGHRLASGQTHYSAPQPPQQIQQQKVVVKTGGRQLGCCGSFLVLIVLLYVYLHFIKHLF